jgi:hypothetical protein
MEVIMSPRHRLLIAGFGAILALSLASSNALGAVPAPAKITPGGMSPQSVEDSYTSNLSFTYSFMGQDRNYWGSYIAIQLTTHASSNGTYYIAPYRQDCDMFGICWHTQVGGYGACPYNGFCGYQWPLSKSGYNFAFEFSKNDGDGVNVHTNPGSPVQMWSGY